jgi:PBSX family phage terminase large subunit
MALTDIYSDKQIEVLRFALKNDFFMLINHGAKRSGKTIIDNDIFLAELMRVRRLADAENVKRPQYILAASDLSSIQRNVLIELANRYGLEFKFDKFNRFVLFGVVVCCFGHSKINDLGRIRGMTSWGAYINEASVANELVFNEIRSRCSAPGARIIMDTNPDRPGHWLKRDFIDKSDQKTIASFAWKLDDNCFLTKRYIENIKKSTPPGAFYERDINGAWVSPEGLVYSDFDTDNWIDSDALPAIREYFAGLDFGWEHAGALILAGTGTDGRTYIIRAWSAKHRALGDWAEILACVTAEYGELPVYCDSARPDMISELANMGFDAVNAKKDVLLGIGYTASLIHTKSLKVCRDGVGDDFRSEIESYAWKSDADEPIKKNDDLMDAMRYAIYSHHIIENEKPRPVMADFMRGGII